MIKRAVPVLITILMFLTTSCGASSLQTNYAAEMQPAIEKLPAWQTAYTALEMDLTDPGTTTNNMSRLEMIELYNMAAEYKITRDDYANLGFASLDLLVGDANKVATQGRNILDTLSTVTPAQETESAHQSVVKCMQARVAFAEGLSASIKNLGPIDLSQFGNSNDCSTFDADLQKLTAYVNDHK
jgi:hypothetical protein